MVLDTRDRMLRGRNKGMEVLYGGMAAATAAILQITLWKAKAYTNGATGEYTKENGRQTL